MGHFAYDVHIYTTLIYIQLKQFTKIHGKTASTYEYTAKLGIKVENKVK